MRNIIKILFLVIITFLLSSSVVSASTLFSDDLKTSYSSYTQIFSSCLPTIAGYDCNAGLVSNNSFPGLKCISVDVDHADFYSGNNTGSPVQFSQLFLTDGGSTWLNNLIGLVLDNGGFPNLYTGTTGFPKIASLTPTPSGKHTWMLCKSNDTFTGYVDGNSIVSYTESGHNSISFAIGGATGTQFSNLLVTDTLPNSGIQLSVPLIKQNAGGWQNMTYDLANIWSPSNSTIGTWGCALTSATMVLNYYNIHKVPNSNLDMTPNNLDAWLGIQPDGYIPNGNVNWLALARLTKQAKPNNPGFAYDALMFNRINSADTPTLLADLTAGHPDILEEPGHFVVATGKNGSAYTINDPFYPHTDLTPYGNTFLSLGRYIPSFTDLSYMLFTSDPSLTITLKDNTNSSVGTSYTQQPLQGDGTALTAGSPINLLYLEQPTNGNYTLTISGSTNQPYSIKGFLYNINGDVKPFTFTGVVGPNNQSIITFNFNSQNPGTFSNDLDNFYNQHLLSNGTYNSLKNVWKNVQKDLQNGNINEAKTLLNTLLTLLKAHKLDVSSSNAYQILLADIQYLQSH